MKEKGKANRSNHGWLAGAALAGTLLVCSIAIGQTNIDPGMTENRYGWSETGRWVNLQGDDDNGVIVRPDYLAGFAWWQDMGWINFGAGPPLDGEHYSNLSAADFGVNNNGRGALSGYAWSECCGWINFDTRNAPNGGSQVTIDPETGLFGGYAWSEGAGWISFTGFDEYVAQVEPAAVVAPNAVTHWFLFE